MATEGFHEFCFNAFAYSSDPRAFAYSSDPRWAEHWERVYRMHNHKDNEMQKRIAELYRQISEQRKWILCCGGSRAGYIAKYGDPGVPPLENGKPKILCIRPIDLHLFQGTHEPVSGRKNCFYEMHFGNGGSAIWEADRNRLLQLEYEYEMLTGQKP